MIDSQFVIVGPPIVGGMLLESNVYVKTTSASIKEMHLVTMNNKRVLVGQLFLNKNLYKCLIICKFALA